MKAKLTYHLTFQNVGTATNTLPLAHLSFAGKHHNVRFVSHRKCSGKTTLLCHFGKLAGGQKKTLTIVVRDLHTGTLKVRAAVLFVGQQADPTPKNNTAQIVTKVTKKGKVKTTSFPLLDSGVAVRGPDQATEGAKVRYHITFTNTGKQTIKQPLYHVRFFGKRKDVELVAHRNCKVQRTKLLLCHLPAIAAGKKRGLTFVIRYHNTGNLKVRAPDLHGPEGPRRDAEGRRRRPGDEGHGRLVTGAAERASALRRRARFTTLSSLVDSSPRNVEPRPSERLRASWTLIRT